MIRFTLGRQDVYSKKQLSEYGETDKSPVALYRWSHIDWESSNNIDREDRLFMAIASSPAGLVLARPAVIWSFWNCPCAIMNNEYHTL